MSSPRQPDDTDPTGIRDLLAALPDPGPMPEDLVARIQARLDVEQAHRASTVPAASGATVARVADGVVDLAAERGRRRPARTVAVLGAAAAGLLVTSVALAQLVDGDGLVGADTAAVYPSLTRAGDDSAGAAQDGGDEAQSLSGAGDDSATGDSGGVAEDGDAASGDPLGAVLSAPDEDLGGRLAVLPGLGGITEAELVPALLASLSSDLHSYGAEDLTLEEAKSCWEALEGPRGFTDYVATRADLGSAASSSPVVAVVGLTADGTGELWALPESCTDGAQVEPVSGPHRVADLP